MIPTAATTAFTNCLQLWGDLSARLSATCQDWTQTAVGYLDAQSVLERLRVIVDGFPTPISGPCSVSTLQAEDPLDPRVPDEAIYERFRGAVFTEIGRGTQSVTYASGNYVVKVLHTVIHLREEDRQALRRNPLTGGILHFFNKHARDSVLWRVAKEQVKLLLIDRCQPQGRLNSEESLRSYRLGLERIPDLVVPYRILQREQFRLRRTVYNPEPIRPSDNVVFQKKVSFFVIDAIREAIASGKREKARALVRQAIEFQRLLWSHGVADLDSGFNIFNNVEAVQGGTFRLVDVGRLSDDPDQTRHFVRQGLSQTAELRKKMVPGRSIGEAVDELTRDGDDRSMQIALLFRDIQPLFRPEDFEMIGREFIEAVDDVFRHREEPKGALKRCL